ncbi:hypothetical protein ACVWXM_002369 [Bradyrhizobium sp. GM7.3]
MLAALIIAFREVFEAGLIVGIVLAVTRDVDHRGRWIVGGVLAGIGGACLVAAFAGGLSQLFAGMGQELFNAAILGIAVVMLTWHNVWMASHGREMALEMRAVGHAVAEGSKPLGALAVVVGVAVLREGSEVALFLYGVGTSEGGSALGLTFGGLPRPVARGRGLPADLFRPGADSTARVVRNDDCFDHPPGGGYGGAGRRLPGAGELANVARQRRVGLGLVLIRSQHSWPRLAHADRL